MARVFISGAQGFVGSYLCHALLNANTNYEILGIGRSPLRKEQFNHQLTWAGISTLAPLPSEMVREVSARYNYVQADIGDRAKLVPLFRDFRPDWVFHLASGLRGDRPLDLCRTNVEGATAVMQALIDSGCRPQLLVYGSSGGVYGLPQRLPLDEEAPTSAYDFYSASKLAAEHVTRILAREHNIPMIWARLFNLVGPGQDERHVCGYFANQLTAIVKGKAPRTLIVQNTNATRDFIDVRDAVRALISLARHGTAGLVYNVASGCEVAISDLLALMLRRIGLEDKILIKQAYSRKNEIPRHFADIHRLDRLKFTRRYTLVESIDDVIAYYSELICPMMCRDIQCR